MAMIQPWYDPRSLAGYISLMYVMPTTVIAEIPTPVSIRVVYRPIGSQTKAFRNEKPAYHSVVRISALFRPTRSENQPPNVEPMNIPMNVIEVRYPIVAMETFQYLCIAGAAKERVLMSPM